MEAYTIEKQSWPIAIGRDPEARLLKSSLSGCSFLPERDLVTMGREDLDELDRLIANGSLVYDGLLRGYVANSRTPPYSGGCKDSPTVDWVKRIIHTSSGVIVTPGPPAGATVTASSTSPPWIATTVTASPAPTTPTTPPAFAGGVRQNWSNHVPADLASEKIPSLVREVFPFPVEAYKPFPYPDNLSVRFHYEGKTKSGSAYSYTCAIHKSVLKYVFLFQDKVADVEISFVENCPVALGYRILFWLQET